jgi:two-component system sensor histidine kinase MtrB
VTRPTDGSRTSAALGRGLRVRIAASFAIGGLLLASAFAVTTYVLADRYLVGQRERTAERQAFLNARALRDELRGPGSDVRTALAALEIPTGSSSVVHRDGSWFGTSVAIGRDSVPRSLRRLVASGVGGHQRVDTTSGPALVTGVPLPSVAAEYYEVVSLHELQNTLAVIRNTLLGAATATTVAAALLGFWAGRRVLRPLREMSGAASAIAGGELSRRLELHRDPDLDPLSLSFNRMVDALQVRIERDTRFASDVSHELRSPLTTLRASAELLDARSVGLDDSVRAPLDLLVAEVRRFERLVTELLELARSDAGVDRVHLEAVKLGELVVHAVAVSGVPDVIVEIDPRLGSDPVVTDKRRLNRVVVNLLENARTHGGGAIDVAVRSDGACIRIEVQDEGEGVAEADRTQIFERFYRGAAAGRRGLGSGTGLGLALVAEHVRVLGGRVWVEDVPGAGGARFVVELPEAAEVPETLA